MFSTVAAPCDGCSGKTASSSEASHTGEIPAAARTFCPEAQGVLALSGSRRPPLLLLLLLLLQGGPVPGRAHPGRYHSHLRLRGLRRSVGTNKNDSVRAQFQTHNGHTYTKMKCAINECNDQYGFALRIDTFSFDFGMWPLILSPSHWF